MELAFRPVLQPQMLKKDLLRFITCGSVDDGKSTLIGRLLHDTKLIFDDQLTALAKESERQGTQKTISILRCCSTASRPSANNASRSTSPTVSLQRPDDHSSSPTLRAMSSSPGIWRPAPPPRSSRSFSLTREKAFWFRPGATPSYARSSAFGTSLLQSIKSILSNLIKEVFDRIVDDYTSFAATLGFSSVVSIPISARLGDNVIKRSDNTPWYCGPVLLDYLETLDVQMGTSNAPFRFPVQLVSRPNQDFRGYAGTVASGQIRKGEPIVVANSGLSSRIREIVVYDGSLETAEAGDAVTLTLTDELDITRGDVLAAPTARPEVSEQFAAHVIWMDQQAAVSWTILSHSDRDKDRPGERHRHQI